MGIDSHPAVDSQHFRPSSERRRPTMNGSITMQAKQLILASGLALATMAVPALAQSGTNNNENIRERGQDRQDRLGDASRAVRQDRQLSSANNILTSLEGIWNVNVMVNRTQWDALDRSRRGSTDRTDQESTNPERGSDRGAREREDQTDAQRLAEREALREAERRGNERDQQGRDTDSTSRTQTGSQMGTADGMARSHTILGGDILRTTVIFGADAASTRTTDPRQNPDRDRQERDADRNPQRDGERNQQRDGMSTTTTMSQMDNSSLRSMSFLGYDQDSGEYNLALMTGQSGTIHYFTGKHNQPDRRIVFKSVNASPVSTSTTGRGSATTSGLSTEGMTVVLQMENNGSYSITAYSDSASTGRDGSSTDLGGQPAQQRDRDADNPSRDRETDRRQGQDGRQATLAPNVIYKATYTKADSTMRSQHDRMFDERERDERDARNDRDGRDGGNERDERTPSRPR